MAVICHVDLSEYLEISNSYVGTIYAINLAGGGNMKTLSNREIVGQLKEFGLSTKTELFMYLILYKSYYSLTYCRTLKQFRGLKMWVDNQLRKFDRAGICYTCGPVPITTQTVYNQRQEKYCPSVQ